MQFPLVKTKTKGVQQKFDLSDPGEREEYFQAKAGEEIKKIKTYLGMDAFIAYLLAKKSAGKGTYSRMLVEIFGADLLAHVSVGDIVRDVDEQMEDPQEREKLEEFLRQNYRGFHSLEEIIKAQEDRDTKSLLPSEFVLALIERKISQMGKKALLIDGFPRGLDQVSYSLFFRSLIDYREDPDFFVLIQVPESVIDERMKYRVVCPKCHLSRNLKLLPTKKIGYDAKKQSFFLRCENPACDGARMIRKEGDEKGIANIQKRLERDEKLIKKAFSLHGVPKVLLRNAVPVDKADEYVDDYEITPEYTCHWDKKQQKVVVEEKPWIIKDDQGMPSYSLLAPAVVISFLKQIVEVLGL